MLKINKNVVIAYDLQPKGIIPCMIYNNYSGEDIMKTYLQYLQCRKDGLRMKQGLNNDHIIYLRAEGSLLPKIPLSKFNYTSGTFEKKWGLDHKTIVLTPNHSSIRKVEIEIQGIDIRNMKLLPNKTGDVIEDSAKIKITRHYRFSEGDTENKKDTVSASPGETKARRIIV
jgi:hypothetical protein